MTQHPDHACALALIDAGCGWAAIAILEASCAPRSAAALRFLRGNRLDLALEQLRAEGADEQSLTPSTITRAGVPGAKWSIER